MFYELIIRKKIYTLVIIKYKYTNKISNKYKLLQNPKEEMAKDGLFGNTFLLLFYLSNAIQQVVT